MQLTPPDGSGGCQWVPYKEVKVLTLSGAGPLFERQTARGHSVDTNELRRWLEPAAGLRHSKY